MVIVNGRIVVAERRIRAVDLAALQHEAQAQYERLRASYSERTPGSPPVETIFPPAFRSD